MPQKAAKARQLCRALPDKDYNLLWGVLMGKSKGLSSAWKHVQGTPIMIGGGVLAYTLLGIDYNEQTGACSFLVRWPEPLSMRCGRPLAAEKHAAAMLLEIVTLRRLPLRKAMPSCPLYTL